jgi:class 3 adenylate cyclase
MIDPVDRAVRAVARRHSSALVWLQFGVAHLVLLAGVGLLSLYEPMSLTRFWVLVAAWLALATLPIAYLRVARRYFLFSYLPLMAFFTWELKLPWYGFFVLEVVGSVVLAYGLILRYFMMEVVVRLEDHADRALRAAMEIFGFVHTRFRGRVEVGIGVNSGTVIAGTVGGGGRVEFTVIGDAVNTAARVEAATRETGDGVLITEDTRRRLRKPGCAFVERKTVELKGKQVHVQLWAPRAYPVDASHYGHAGASVVD